MEPFCSPYRLRKEIAAFFGFDLKGYVNDFFQKTQNPEANLWSVERKFQIKFVVKTWNLNPDHDNVTNFTKYMSTVPRLSGSATLASRDLILNVN